MLELRTELTRTRHEILYFLQIDSDVSDVVMCFHASCREHIETHSNYWESATVKGSQYSYSLSLSLFPSLSLFLSLHMKSLLCQIHMPVTASQH